MRIFRLSGWLPWGQLSSRQFHRNVRKLFMSLCCSCLVGHPSACQGERSSPLTFGRLRHKAAALDVARTLVSGAPTLLSALQFRRCMLGRHRVRNAKSRARLAAHSRARINFARRVRRGSAALRRWRVPSYQTLSQAARRTEELPATLEPTRAHSFWIGLSAWTCVHYSVTIAGDCAPHCITCE